MKILVCLKQVIDVELNIQIKDGQLVEDGLRYVINAYDESALEAALRLKDAHDADVTVLSMGPERVQEALRKGLSMGADRAIHLQDSAFEGGDSHAFARALASLVKARSYDLVLMGKQSQDTDAAHAGAMLAELLDWPQATNLVQVEREAEGRVQVSRNGDDGKEILSIQLPAVFTVSNDFGEARLPTMKGIMGAKKKELEVLSLNDIGLSAEDAGKSGARIEVVGREAPERRKTGRKMTGDAATLSRDLVQWLVSDAKMPV